MCNSFWKFAFLDAENADSKEISLRFSVFICAPQELNYFLSENSWSAAIRPQAEACTPILG
jgi:hypothetical protein